MKVVRNYFNLNQYYPGKMFKQTYYAVISGTCSSAASIFGKLMGLPLFEDLFVLRVVCFFAMLMCNACVWTFFVKALQASQSSLTATIISTSTNYLISGILGFLIFHEVTSVIWWSGTSLILLGLILIGGQSAIPKIESKSN